MDGSTAIASLPLVSQLGPNCYRALWDILDGEVTVLVDRLKTHSDGRTTARVRVQLESDRGELPLYNAQANISSGQARRQIARALEQDCPLAELPWTQVLEMSFQGILAAFEDQEPIFELRPLESGEPETEYLLRPLLPKGSPVILYAPPGQGKSYAALLVALLVENGLTLDGKPGPQGRVLVIDYETDEQTARKRLTKLARGLERSGFGRVKHFPLYRFSTRPLADQVDELAQIIAEQGVVLLIIDSIGLAAGGDLYSPESAVSFFRALRQICSPTGATSLSLGHTNKDDRRAEDQVRLIFGSVYFEALARCAWEVRATEGSSKNELRLSFLARKSNEGPQDKFGLALTFQCGAVLVHQVAAEDVLSESGTTRQMILLELQHGPATVAELVEAVGASAPAVRMALSRLKVAGRVQPLKRGTWALAETAEV